MAGRNTKDKSMLTASEACALLGIKAQTLYAYVSRGLLRAETHPGRTGKLYARDDIETLLARSRARSGHGPTAASAMRWGDPILDSAITCIQAGQIYYRGYALRELLRKGISFEQTAELLWSGDLPHHKVQWTALPIEVPSAGLETKASLSRRLLHRLAGLALLDPEGGSDELIDQTLRRARGLIRHTTDALFPIATQAGGSLSQRMATALNLEQSEAVEAIETALLVSADHELNASTFAARVAASTGADLYASLLAALATFSGRHHGLASIEVHAFLTEPPAGWSRRRQLNAWMEGGQLLPGFGHRLYAEGDPRVEPLLQKARTLANARKGEASRWMDEVEGVLNLAKTMGSPAPNLDFALVAVALALDLPREGAATLFLIGRLAGWTAHILEQRQQGFLLRPRARYVGRAPMTAPNGNG
ncbi:citrate synthase family protein [Oligoflexus tunisiensis]|uniref:citrate synthase family protein n=1 Tax=Oligoflexus tunisiensis TaxID=708132 RepID=UPI000A3EEAC2|nr:citrate synthase family protein [Oligoflexus tunisiensis]